MGDTLTYGCKKFWSLIGTKDFYSFWDDGKLQQVFWDINIISHDAVIWTGSRHSGVNLIFCSLNKLHLKSSETSQQYLKVMNFLNCIYWKPIIFLTPHLTVPKKLLDLVMLTMYLRNSILKYSLALRSSDDVIPKKLINIFSHIFPFWIIIFLC